MRIVLTFKSILFYRLISKDSYHNTSFAYRIDNTAETREKCLEENPMTNSVQKKNKRKFSQLLFLLIDIQMKQIEDEIENQYFSYQCS